MKVCQPNRKNMLPNKEKRHRKWYEFRPNSELYTIKSMAEEVCANVGNSFYRLWCCFILLIFPLFSVTPSSHNIKQCLRNFPHRQSTTLRFFDFAIQLAERWIRFVNCWPRFFLFSLAPTTAIITPIALLFYWFSYSLFAFFHIFLVAQSYKKIFRKHRLFMLKKSNSLLLLSICA